MVDPQTSFLLKTVGLFIEILGAWSVYVATPKLESNQELTLDAQSFIKKIRRGYFNLGLFLTLGSLMQYLANQ